MVGSRPLYEQHDQHCTRSPMCLACEQQEYFFRLWCADFVAKGEMPPGVTVEDLEALGLPPPKPAAGGSEPKELGEAGSRRQRVRLRQSGRMTDLTSLTIADARDRLRNRDFSATELADAHLAAIERARALNAYVLETPDQARVMARASDARLKAGRRAAARGHSTRHQGPVRDQGRAHHGRARTSSTISFRPTSRPSAATFGATAP